MLRGMYTAASGMLAEQVRTDVLANNLANAQTVAFKRDAVIQSAFPDMLIRRVFDPVNTVGSGANRPFFGGDGLRDQRPVIGRLGTGAYVEGTWAVQEEGPLRYTGNALDVALTGEGFFTVQTDAGVRFTRDGRFTLDGNGRLVTIAGLPVLDSDGEPITIQGDQVLIDETGQIWVDGEAAATLAVWSFPQPQWLRREGAGIWALTDEAGEPQPADTAIQSGYVEQANVNVITSMVELITAFRSYEANQKIVQAYDETLGKVVNELGRA